MGRSVARRVLASLAAGWAIAAGIAAFLAGVEAGPVLGLAAASLSLLVAHRALPRRAHPVGGVPAPAWACRCGWR